MGKRRLGILLTIITLVLAAGVARETEAEGVFDREYFRIREGLVPDFPDEGTIRISPPSVRLSPEPVLDRKGAELKSGGGREEGVYNFRLGSFRLFFSRYASGEGKGRELFRPPEGRNTLLGAVQTLPGTLRSDPTRAMESVGTIFEPQMNLQIEF